MHSLTRQASPITRVMDRQAFGTCRENTRGREAAQTAQLSVSTTARERFANCVRQLRCWIERNIVADCLTDEDMP